MIRLTKPLAFIELRVLDGDVLLIPAVIRDWSRPGARLETVHSIKLNGVPLRPTEYLVFDGTQTEVCQVLVDNIDSWDAKDLLHDIPFVVLQVPYREEFKLMESGMLSAIIDFTEGVPCVDLEVCSP